MLLILAFGFAVLASALAWGVARRSDEAGGAGVLGAGLLAFAVATALPLLGSDTLPRSARWLAAVAGGSGVLLLFAQAWISYRSWSERAARLRRWNERLGALLSRGPMWAAWLHDDLRIRFVNDGLAHQLRRTPAAAAGLQLEELLGASDIARIRERVAGEDPDLTPWQTELRLPDREERVPVEVSAVLGPRDASGAAGVGVLLRDMREQRRARLEEQRRERLDALLASISTELSRTESRELEPAIERALGRIGEFTGADRASTRVIDADKPELVRRCQLWVAPHVDRSLAPDELSVADAPDLLRRLQAGEVVRMQAEGGREGGSAEGAGLLARGGVRSAMVFPLSVQGELFGGCVLAWEERDCPIGAEDERSLRLAADAIGSALARQRAAQTLRRKEDLLRQAQRMEAVGELAGGIAHDFNNLLTVISGYAAGLRVSSRLGEEERLHVEQIARAGERAAGLTSRLLAFGRRQRREPRNLDLGARIATLEPMLQRTLGPSIQLVIERQANLPAVHADPAQLDQVVLNLVLNARDAVGEHGSITLATKRVRSHRERAVCLEVSDDGCGIAPEHRDRIFEPFFTTKAVGQGTGLGLAMVHGIVHQSGGSIEVESEVGVGTVFRVILPVAEGMVADPITPLPTPARLASELSGRILLVEDEQQVRDLAVYALRAAGFAVFPAADGEQGLALAQDDLRGFDAIVTDVVMPRLSGPEMVAQLPPRYRDVPVLYISGYHPIGVERASNPFPGAAARLFEKPFTPQQLVEQLTALLRG